MENFSQLSGSTKADFERIEFARRSASDSDLQLALRRAFRSLNLERGDPIAKRLADQPELRDELNEMWDRGCGRTKTRTGKIIKKDLSAGITPGSPWTVPYSVLVSQAFFDLLPLTGKYSKLGVIDVPSPFTKVVRVLGYPDYTVLTTATQGTQTILAGDSLWTGKFLLEAANSYLCRVEISLDLGQDIGVDVSHPLLKYMLRGTAKGLDQNVFAGTGADDGKNGATVGLFVDGGIASNPANPGNTRVENLVRDDFLNTMASVNSPALERPCRWFVASAFLPLLLRITAGAGTRYLVSTPAETGGTWEILGSELVFTAAAPAVNAPGQKIAAFGEPNCWATAIRDRWELMIATWVDGRAMWQIRSNLRGRASIIEQAGFAILKTAAQ